MHHVVRIRVLSSAPERLPLPCLVLHAMRSALQAQAGTDFDVPAAIPPNSMASLESVAVRSRFPWIPLVHFITQDP